MRSRSLFHLGLIAQLASSQVPEATRQRGNATISGIVSDSVARTPLVGAAVQLMVTSGQGITRGAISDSLGHFALEDVPEGHYMIGFIHPMLDSLGLEPVLREVFVDGSRPVRADLAIPSPARIRASICGERKDGAVLMGIVRSARDHAPMSGASVTAEWVEYTVRGRSLAREVPRALTRTAPNGWFAVCNVPRAGSMMLMASNGADSSERIEVELSQNGFTRRELYVGGNGTGRLSGTVFGAVGLRPIPGAVVTVAGSPSAVANEVGQWSLVSASLGTRMLDVRAIGYYPQRRAVNIVAGMPEVHLNLSTFKAVLDTVRTVARRRGRDVSGFDDRRVAGMGKFLTSSDVEKFRAQVVSDLFKNMSGVRIVVGEDGFTKRYVVRGNLIESCYAQIILDGRLLTNFNVEDLDDAIVPGEISGIEVYAGVGSPPEFSGGLMGDGCGTIAIWSKVGRFGPGRQR